MMGCDDFANAFGCQGDRGGENHEAKNNRRDCFRLPMAVGMFRIGGSGGDF